MKALILAGGFATRLRPLSCTRPKILFPIIDKPLLQWTFEGLAKQHVAEAILAVNHQTETAIRQHHLLTHGLKVRYSRDPPSKPLGSGGPIKKAQKLLRPEEPFLVLNGDILSDIDYGRLLKAHEENKALATIALTKVRDPSRYGVVRLSKENQITEFVEKPDKKEAPTNLINAGTYALSPRILDYIPARKTVSIERDVFTELAKEGELYGYIHKNMWIDIGKPEDYLEAHRILLRSIGTRQPRRYGDQIKVNEPVFLDRTASVDSGCNLGPYVVVGKRVKIGRNVRLKNTIIFPRANVADNSAIEGAIIGESVQIGKEAMIRQGCVIGDNVKVGDNVALAAGVRICPAREVDDNLSTAENIC